MFTPGRIAFLISFAAVFIIALIWTYKKDKKERAANFKGSTKIVLTVIVFLIALTSLVRVLRHF